MKPQVVIKKSRAELIAELKAAHPETSPLQVHLPSYKGSTRPTKQRWRAFQWMKIPLDARLDIISALSSSPFPWRTLLYQLQAKHGITHSQITSLAWSIMRCGFDDPYIAGKKSLDELRDLLQFKSDAAEVGK